jgi:hypothetical protein
MPLSKISKSTAMALQDMLLADKQSAMSNEPDVGVFRNDDLISAIELLISYVEEKTGVGALW